VTNHVIEISAKYKEKHSTISPPLVIKGMRFLKKNPLGSKHFILIFNKISLLCRYHCLEIEKKGWGMKEGPKGGGSL